jgi:hypothetical protein
MRVLQVPVSLPRRRRCVFEQTLALLQRRGVEAENYERASGDIGAPMLRKAAAVVRGIYSPRAAPRCTRRLRASSRTWCIRTTSIPCSRPRCWTHALRREKLHRFLPRAKATRGRRYFKRRRDPIPGRTPIHERPRAVETREQFGHWEDDLMQFRTQRGNLLTLCETRFTFTAPLGNKQAETTDDALREILGPLPEPARRSGHLRQRQRIRPSEPQRRAGDANLLLRPPFPSAARAPSKTPMASSAATCPEKSTFTTTPPGTSTTSPGPSTQHPENPSASKHPLKPSSKTSGPALYLLIQCKHRRSEVARVGFGSLPATSPTPQPSLSLAAASQTQCARSGP